MLVDFGARYTLDLFSKSLSIYDFRHNHNTAELSKLFSIYLGLELKTINDLTTAALYHDIGKAYIPETILNKREKLNRSEYEIIREHPVYSYKIMKELKIEDKICRIVLHHHEFYDGSGYPSKLKEKEIPLESRILCIVDNYDALSTARPYKKKLEKNDVINIMKKESYKFDPDLLDSFFTLIQKIQ